MTSQARRAEIAERAEMATEGPWQVDGQHVWVAVGSQECCGNPIQESDDGILVTGEHCCGQPVVNWQQTEIAQSGETDALFIAHARDDIPWLLAELTRLTAEVADYQRREEWIKKAATSADEKIINLTAQVEGIRANVIEECAKVAGDMQFQERFEWCASGDIETAIRALAARPGVAREECGFE